MTAKIIETSQLDPDSLQFTVFENIRRIGADRADGGTFFHEGIEYGLTVDMPCRLELTHVVVERVSGPLEGYQQAIAFLCLTEKNRHDVYGLGLLMQALATGVVIKDAIRPEKLSWRVLPWLPVPDCYAKPGSSDE